MVATWGTLSWRASRLPARESRCRRARATRGRLTRRGATGRRRTRNANGSTITSPKARYLQWRAVLDRQGRHRRCSRRSRAAYQQRNVRPEVDSVTVHPPGVVFQKPFSTGETEIAGFDDDTGRASAWHRTNPGSAGAGAPSLGRRTYQKGLQTFVWKAEDENGDELDLRRALSPRGRNLVEAAQERPHRFDSGVGHDVGAERHLRAEGRRVRCASRIPSDTALRGERESASFDIDNSAAVGHARRATP